MIVEVDGILIFPLVCECVMHSAAACATCTAMYRSEPR